MSMVTTSSSCAGPLDVGQRGLHVAHAVDLAVDLVLVGLGPVELDPQRAVARDLHLGPHLDHGVEDDVALLLPGGDLDLGRVDRVDVVVVDRPHVVLGERVLQRLLAADLGAEAALEHLSGGLAGPEPGDADLAAILRKATSIALSNSWPSTSTESLTLFPSRGETVDFTGARV